MRKEVDYVEVKDFVKFVYFNTAIRLVSWENEEDCCFEGKVADYLHLELPHTRLYMVGSYIDGSRLVIRVLTEDELI